MPKRDKQGDIGGKFNLAVAHEPLWQPAAVQPLDGTHQGAVNGPVHRGRPEQDARQCGKVDDSQYHRHFVALCVHVFSLSVCAGIARNAVKARSDAPGHHCIPG